MFQVIADYTGHTMDEVKTEAKRNFAAEFDEYGIPFIKGTSEMNVAEATNFIDKCYMWAHSTWPELNLSTEDYKNALKQL
jgi:hypothetical protein